MSKGGLVAVHLYPRKWKKKKRDAVWQLNQPGGKKKEAPNSAAGWMRHNERRTSPAKYALYILIHVLHLLPAFLFYFFFFCSLLWPAGSGYMLFDYQRLGPPIDISANPVSSPNVMMSLGKQAVWERVAPRLGIINKPYSSCLRLGRCRCCCSHRSPSPAYIQSSRVGRRAKHQPQLGINLNNPETTYLLFFLF